VKKSTAELLEMGWAPCDPPRVAIGFRWPYKEIVKCKSCNGKGAIWMYDQGYGKGLGQCYRKKCACRGGQQTALHVDAEIRVALDWFKTSTPPASGFELWLFKDYWKVIDSPVEYWAWLRSEIATDNIYRIEAVRDDLVKLHQKFMVDEEF
jgi:hypothetical protein